MQKILLVEDDQDTVILLNELFIMEGFDIVSVNNGEEALTLLREDWQSFGVILLDVMMPKKSGIEVLKELRKICQTAVIMLTAKGSELDLILGLELGADDYLPKPFNDRELLARVRALLRRTTWNEIPSTANAVEEKKTFLKIDDLELNVGRQEAKFNGKNIDLTGTEFTMLYHLASNLGKVVSREDLSQTVLSKRLTPYDRAIDMHISNLRRKLPKRKDGQLWFKTLRGRGYLMVTEN